jgi:hypothetical protein
LALRIESIPGGFDYYTLDNRWIEKRPNNPLLEDHLESVVLHRVTD